MRRLCASGAWSLFSGGVSHQVARLVYRGEVWRERDPCGRAFVVAGKPCPSPNGAILYRPMIADEWPENTRQQQ